MFDKNSANLYFKTLQINSLKTELNSELLTSQKKNNNN